MGGGGSKPWKDAADARVFDVFDLDKKCKAQIAFAYPSFYFQTKGFSLQCSLTDIRGYAQRDKVFSFETGRNCPGGSNRYFARVKGKENLHTVMSQLVKSRMNGESTASATSSQTEVPKLPRRKQETRAPAPQDDYEDPNQTMSLATPTSQSYNQLQRQTSGSSQASDSLYNHLDRNAAAARPSSDYNHLSSPVSPSSRPASQLYNTLNSTASPPHGHETYNTLDHSSGSAPSENYSTLQHTDRVSQSSAPSDAQYNVLQPAAPIPDYVNEGAQLPTPNAGYVNGFVVPAAQQNDYVAMDGPSPDVQDEYEVMDNAGAEDYEVPDQVRAQPVQPTPSPRQTDGNGYVMAPLNPEVEYLPMSTD
eukprot:m.46634 g.46634  ORF g.46634 m.46634 type:complete len:363 (-) comp13163_c0_seq3:150-1238(-)